MGLDGGLVRSAGLLAPDQPSRETVGIGLTGQTRGQAFLLRNLQLGDYRFGTPLAHAQMADSQNSGGVIGAELLRQTSLTFDYPRRRVWLKASSREPRAAAYDKSGLVLIAEGDNFDTVVVQFVESGSPAARAGIVSGDIVTAVDAGEASSLRLSGVTAVLTGGGTTVRVRIKRGDGEMTVILPLPESFPAPSGQQRHLGRR